MEYTYHTAPPHSYPLYLPPTPAANSTPHGGPFVPTLPTSFDGPYHSHTYDPRYSFGDAQYPDGGHSPPPAINEPSTAQGEHPNGNPHFPVNGGNPIPGSDVTGAEETGRNRSSSEEKDSLTPAQSRRKAQNRAAQRAFRERKERHVKDLEHKLTSLQQTSSSLSGEVERLRRELAKTKTENDILKATNGGGSSSVSITKLPNYAEEPTMTGPMHFAPTDLYTPVLDPASGKVTTARRSPSHRVATSENGEKLLNAGATWDLIQASDMFKRGLVDVGDVCERLKHMAKCDGQGPVFEESDVKGAIEESAAGGTDELIY